MIGFAGSAQGGVSHLWRIADGVQVSAVHAGPWCAPRGYDPRVSAADAIRGLKRLVFALRALAPVVAHVSTTTSEHHAQSSRLRGWLNSGSNCPPCEDDGALYASVKPVGLSAIYPPPHTHSRGFAQRRTRDPGSRAVKSILRICRCLSDLRPYTWVPGPMLRIVPGMGGVGICV